MILGSRENFFSWFEIRLASVLTDAGPPTKVVHQLADRAFTPTFPRRASTPLPPSSPKKKAAVNYFCHFFCP